MTLRDYSLTRNARGEAKSQAHRQPKTGFLIFVWIAVALGVVAFFEPAPSDIGFALLMVQGIVFANLRWTRALTVPLVLLGFFVLANLTSLCFAIDPAQGAVYLLVTCFMLVSWLFVVGLLAKFEERGLTILMSGYTIGGVVSALLAILAYFNLIPFTETLLFYDRIKGFFKDPNVFGPYLVIAAAYALLCVQMGKGSKVSKGFWLASCLISTIGVLLCYSRAGWANFAITFFAYFALNAIANRKQGALKKNIIFFIIISVVLGAVIAYAMTLTQVGNVVASRTEVQTYDEDRFATHDAAIELGLEHPLGVGPGQSFLLLDYATHSLYLRVFSENGVIGLASFLAFLLLTLARAVVLSQRASNSFQRSMFSLVAAAITGALFNSFLIDTLHWRHFWLLLALAWMPLWKTTEKPASGTARQRFRRRPSLAPGRLMHTPVTR